MDSPGFIMGPSREALRQGREMRLLLSEARYPSGVEGSDLGDSLERCPWHLANPQPDLGQGFEGMKPPGNQSA